MGVSSRFDIMAEKIPITTNKPRYTIILSGDVR
jgi:hypothetical protein